jgi:hypothetical protein
MRAKPDRYGAFISYSHQQDRVLAKALHSELQRFARPWYRPRALRIFRDETNLQLTPNAWTGIQAELERSDWFILMASPASAASKWVRREIGWWITHRRTDRMLLALTGGDIRWAEHDFDWGVTTALPGDLAGKFREEPLWIDLRQLTPADPGAPGAPASITLGDLVAEFAAPIRNRPKDSLIGAHLRLGRRIRQLVTAVVVVLSLLLVTAVVAAYIANEQRAAAQRQARIAKSQQLAANVEALLPTNLDLAQLLAAQAYRLDRNQQSRISLFRAVPTRIDGGCFGCAPPKVVLSPESKYALIRSGSGGIVTFRELTAAGAETSLGGDDQFYGMLGWNADGTRWLVQAPDGGIEARSTAAGTPVVQRLEALRQYTVLALTPDGGRAVTFAQGRLELRTTADGALVRGLLDGLKDVQGILVAPDVSRVALQDGSGTIVDTATGTRTTVGSGTVAALTFDHDHLIVQRRSGALEIWDGTGSRLQHCIQQDKSYLPSTPTFRTPPSLGGGILVQQRSDGGLALTDIGTDTLLGLLPGIDFAKLGVTMLPSGQRLITAAEGPAAPGRADLVLWYLTPEAWFASACGTAGRDVSDAERGTYLGPIVRPGPTCPQRLAVPLRAAPAPDAAAQAEQLSKALQQMSGQRQAIRNPIDQAARCAGEFHQHKTDLDVAAGAREYLGRQLADLEVTGLPDGALLKSGIRAALNISAAVDREFALWVADLQTAGCVSSTATSNPHYVRALKLSTLATLEKVEIAKLWAKVASQYGHRAWQANEI